MKKITFIVIIYLSSFTFAYPQSMISLDKYISENDASKPSSLVYLTNRCSALYTYISGLIVEKNKNLSDNYMNSAGKLSFVASELMRTEFGNTEEESIKSSMTTVLKMLDFYKEDSANNYAKTGEYILGSYMEQDANYCKMITETLL
jgi:hypothetical protein